MDNDNQSKKTTDELIAEYLAKQISESDQDNRLIKKLSSATALIAAIATLIGAISSWNSANNANKSAEDIKALLKTVNVSEAKSEARRELMNENQALLNLYNNDSLNAFCIQIPLTNTEKWNNYKKCMALETGKPLLKLGEPDIEAVVRNICGRQVKACKNKN